MDSFVHDLPGQTIERIGRRGKYLLFYLTGGVLVSHLRMEGKYLFYPDEVPERKHAHVFFETTDGGTLVYEDVRLCRLRTKLSGSKISLQLVLSQQLHGPKLADILINKRSTIRRLEKT